MKRLLVTLIALCVGLSAKAQPKELTLKDLQKDQRVVRALALFNAARRAAGLEEVTLSPELSTGCRNHAVYLALNEGHPLTRGLKAHDESKELQGYTDEGAKAGKASVINFGQTPDGAIGSWLGTFYHRIPMLQPGLSEVGIGWTYRGSRIYCVLDCLSGLKRDGKRPASEVVLYPADGQKQVPLTFNPASEIPNPVPAAPPGLTGYPITASWFGQETLQDMTMTVRLAGRREIPGYVSTPENPATDFTQWNTVCFIPKAPLIARAFYEVELKGTVAGKPFSKKWKFVTLGGR